MPIFLLTIAALALTMVLIPPLIRVAPYLGLVDRPNHRKVHAKPMPRIGGVAIVIGCLLPLLVATTALTGANIALLVAAVIMLLTGLVDDRIDMPWFVKLFFQLIAASVAVYYGDIRIETFTLVDRLELPQYWSIPISVLFLAGLTNGINFSDGLDGLAAGTSLLYALGLAVFGFSCGNQQVLIISAVLCGALLGFLRFNTHPARVFMGDAGSQFIGFMVAVLAIKTTQGETTAISAAVPLLLLAWPILDTMTIVVVRSREDRSPFISDSSHLHHRMLRLGLQQREVVTIMYCVQALLLLGAFLLRFESDVLIASVFLLFAAVVTAVIETAERRGWKRRPQGQPALQAPRPSWWTRSASWVDRGSMLALQLLLVVYVIDVCTSTMAIAQDVSILVALLLLSTLALWLLPWTLPRGPLLRAVAYISVAALVYLDESGFARSEPQSVLKVALFVSLAAALALRYGLQLAPQPGLTPLDALVAFVALASPWIATSIGLPPQFAMGFVKVAVLCYAIELMPAQTLQRREWYSAISVSLCCLLLRGLTG